MSDLDRLSQARKAFESACRSPQPDLDAIKATGEGLKLELKRYRDDRVFPGDERWKKHMSKILYDALLLNGPREGRRIGNLIYGLSLLIADDEISSSELAQVRSGLIRDGWSLTYYED